MTLTTTAAPSPCCDATASRVRKEEERRGQKHTAGRLSWLRRWRKLDISYDLFVFLSQCCTYSFASMFRANCWIPHQKKSKSITAANATVYIKASAASVVIPTSPVQMCLCDISFRSAALLQIIHSLDMSHTETKLYLLLNRISDGAALLENCML